MKNHQPSTSCSSSLQNTKPSDFHHLQARFRLPFAPVFLPKPNRKKLYEQGVDIKDEQEDGAGRSSDSEADEKESFEPQASNSTSGGALEAVNQSMASLLMKYVPSLGAVLVSYLASPTFIFRDQTGRESRQKVDKIHRLPIPTLPGSGWGAIKVEVGLLGWRPTIGDRLVGRPTLSTPSHLSLVLYRTFNASIPENHLKFAGYYYDLNLDVPQSWREHGGLLNTTDADKPETNPESLDGGCWVDADGNIVGGTEGLVAFTVLSLTIANNMISVTGSLHSDPFSLAAPAPTSQPASRPERSSSESHEEEVQARSMAPTSSLTHQSSPRSNPKPKSKSRKKSLAITSSSNLIGHAGLITDNVSTSGSVKKSLKRTIKQSESHPSSPSGKKHKKNL